jgi:uncharacterized protein (TIGR00730 family)
MHTVCVFCGSRTGHGDVYRAAARRFGELLAAQGHALVYGGGHVGLMGELADAVLARGGKVIGVIPQFMVGKELAHAGLTELIVVETMHQRKAIMADRADAFAALPGGDGTAEELFEITTWAQLKLHAKPIGLLNVGGYFDALLAWRERMVTDGFLKPANRERLLVAAEPQRLLDLLAAWRPAEALEKPGGDVR